MRTIDTDRCTGCGTCAADCVIRYISLKENENGLKVASFKERGKCMECGHCNAICPNGAISGGDRIIRPLSEMDSMLRLMSEKRTIRSYKKGAAIQQSVLDKIVFAAQTSPSGRNRRSVTIVFVKDNLSEVYNKALDYLVEDVERTGTINPLYSYIMDLNKKRDEVLWNAEYLVVLTGKPECITDATITAERMQLEAANCGVGSAYRGDMKWAINKCEELRGIIGLKALDEVLVCFAMGIPDVKYYRPAVKNNKSVVFM